MLKSLVFIAVSFLLFCAYPVSAQSQGPTPSPRKLSKPVQSPTQNKEQKPKPDKRGTEQSPLVVKTIPTTKSQNEIDQERSEREEKAALDRKLVWATKGLYIVGIIQAVILLGQIILYWRTLTETKKAANAARDSAKVAKTALQVAERAYLKINNFELVKPKVDEYPTVTYEIQNVGHTPAQIIECLAVIDILDNNYPKTPIYDTEINLFGPRQTSIQPNEKRSMFGNRKKVITLGEMDCINNNSKLIFAWGRIIFRDVFDNLWVNGFGVAFIKTLGAVMMDGYNYSKKYEPDKEQS